MQVLFESTEWLDGSAIPLRVSVPLQAEAVAAAKAAATQLLVRAAALRDTCTRVMAEYRLFFSWMLRTVLRLGDGASQAAPSMGGPIDVAAVASFLRGQFHVDSLGRELQVPPFCSRQRTSHTAVTSAADT